MSKDTTRLTPLETIENYLGKSVTHDEKINISDCLMLLQIEHKRSERLINLTRQFLQKYHRYHASMTMGRFKEMQAAEKELSKELEFHEVKPVEGNGGLF